MDVRTYLLIAAFVILGALGSWIAHGSDDRERIRRYIHARRGKVLAIGSPSVVASLAGGAGGRTYEVDYLDREGNHHRARCHTTGWIGVFFADDQIISPGDPRRTIEELEEENRRLREELDRLKRKPHSDAIEE